MKPVFGSIYFCWGYILNLLDIRGFFDCWLPKICIFCFLLKVWLCCKFRLLLKKYDLSALFRGTISTAEKVVFRSMGEKSKECNDQIVNLNWNQRSSLWNETSEKLWTYSLTTPNILAVSRTSQQAGTALAGRLHLLPSQVWFGTSCVVQLWNTFYCFLLMCYIYQILLLLVYSLALTLATE